MKGCEACAKVRDLPAHEHVCKVDVDLLDHLGSLDFVRLRSTSRSSATWFAPKPSSRAEGTVTSPAFSRTAKAYTAPFSRAPVSSVAVVRSAAHIESALSTFITRGGPSKSPTLRASARSITHAFRARERGSNSQYETSLEAKAEETAVVVGIHKARGEHVLVELE